MTAYVHRTCKQCGGKWSVTSAEAKETIPSNLIGEGRIAKDFGSRKTRSQKATIYNSKMQQAERIRKNETCPHCNIAGDYSQTAVGAAATRIQSKTNELLTPLQASWRPDITKRHSVRYFDGTKWTEKVSDAGDQSEDVYGKTIAEELMLLQPVSEYFKPKNVGWFRDPTTRHQTRYWDGMNWVASVGDQGNESDDEEGMKIANGLVSKTAINLSMKNKSPQWKEDPTKRHALRFWDGKNWTNIVSDKKENSEDDLGKDLANEILVSRRNKNRWILGTLISGFILLIVLAGIFGEQHVEDSNSVNDSSTEELYESSTTYAANYETMSTKAKQTAAIPPYEIVHEYPDARFDGGAGFYVLVDPIATANSNFKSSIEALIGGVVEKKGASINVVVCDDRPALELAYQLYGPTMRPAPPNSSESAVLERHVVATFLGNLSSGTYLNTLTYFPNAFTSTPEIGQYVATIEFNP